MKKIKYNNERVLVSKDEACIEFEKLKLYISELSQVEGTNPINVPLDKNIVLEVQKAVDKFRTKNLKYIFLIGIGGSNLGTQAIIEATVNKFQNDKKIFFLDTIDSKYLALLFRFLDSNLINKDDFVINLVSKSGNTIESIVNFEILHNYLKDKFGNITDRIVVITDNDSNLNKIALEKNYTILEIPKDVGGRFSVFTSVGLFPLALLDLNIYELLEGAKNSVENSLSLNFEENSAAISAIDIFLNYKNNRNILNNFFFEPSLEYVGKWYRQLVGESACKRLNIVGKEVRVGITPIVSIGSTDLHSMAQLYFGGPKDKYTNFITVENKIIFNIPQQLENLVGFIKNKDSKIIFNAIYEGVKKSYENENLPYSETILEDLSEESLGEFLQFKMLEIIFLCKLLNVNAFDQPEVELYKSETRRILTS